MTRKPKLLIFGIDGAAYPLVQQWMASGQLPALAAFARSAAVAPLRCTWPPHTATGWPTLFSGRLPGEHGLFQFWECQATDYQLHVTPRSALGCPLLWDVLTEAGWTMGLVNLPMSHPMVTYPGYQISWPLVPTLRYCYPTTLLREISAAGGLALPDIACMYDGAADYPARAVGYIRDRTTAMRYLMENHPTDAVVVVYTEVDRVSHPYWHGLDQRHPHHAQASAADKRVVADIYAEIDAAFAALLALVDDDCTVLVVSDHGFGANTRCLRIHHLLAEGGFCRWQPTALSSVSSGSASEAGATTNFLQGMDWSQTQVYMPTPGCFGLNVNLVGRQQAGTVTAVDKPALLAAVTTYLLSLTDPADGQTLFAAIVPGQCAYAGPYADRAPDLLLVPRDPALMILPDLAGPTWSESTLSGLHRQDGIWLLRGPHMGRRDNPTMMPIEQVAGDLLTVLGLGSDQIPIRQDAAPLALQQRSIPVDAWTVSAAESKGWVAAPSPFAQSLIAADSSPLPLTGIENKAIENRLRALGYL